MINTGCNGNGVAINSTGSPFQDKQLYGAIKKTALRDVQNENLGSTEKQQKSLLPGGTKSSGDAIKVCGTKRLTPERASSSQSLPSLSHNGTNENVMNARRRIELELGKGRLHNNVENYSDSLQSKKITQSWQEIPQMTSQERNINVMSNIMTPIMAFSSSAPSFPSSFGKHNEAVKVPTELPRAVHSKSNNDQLRAECYNRLQMFLKQCDEANQREFIQMLLHLSPADLSKHAWELEKRAIKLALEEGNEMKRKTSLNILAKPSPSNNLMQSSKS